jgi:hypothetical protein
LRLFEAAWGSGYGARVFLDAFSAAGARRGGPLQSFARKDGAIFGEFVGSVVLEVSSKFDLDGQLAKVRYQVIGEVLPEPRLVLQDRTNVVWQDTTEALGEVWGSAFREVIE